MKKTNICVISRSQENLKRLFASMRKYVSKETLDNSIISLSWNGESSEIPEIEEMMSFVDHKIFQMPYNFSKNCNALVQNQESEQILLLNDDIELNSDPITICSHALENPDIGLVGLRLVYPNGTIQHFGQVLVLDENDNMAGVSHYMWKRNDSEVPKKNILVEGVTAAFLMCRRDEYLKIKMNEDFEVAFQDVIFNFKYRAIFDRKVVCIGETSAIHYESQTRGKNSLTLHDVKLMARIFQQHKDLILRNRSTYPGTIVNIKRKQKQ